MTEDIRVKAGDVFGDGFKHYFSNIVTILLIDLVSLVPMMLLNYYVVIQKSQGPILLLILPVIFLLLTNQGSIFTILDRSGRGEKTGFMEAFMAGINKSFKVLCIGMIYGVIMMGGLLLLIIPGIVFAIKYSFSTIAAVIEDKKLSALKVSSALAKGYAGLIILMGLFMCALAVVPNFLIYSPASTNLPVFLLLAIPLTLITTIAQSVQFSAYKLIKQARPEAVVPDETKKPMGLFAGCLISTIAMVVIIAGLSIAGIYVSKNYGMDKVMRMIFGSTMKLTENLSVEAPEKWSFMPANKDFTAYMLMNGNPEDEQGITGVFIRSVSLDSGLTGYLTKKSTPKQAVGAILSLEAMNNITPSWGYSGLKKSTEVKLGGNIWNRLSFKSVDNAAMKEWILYYTVSKTDLVYFYFGKLAKGGEGMFEKDEKTLKGMFGK